MSFFKNLFAKKEKVEVKESVRELLYQDYANGRFLLQKYIDLPSPYILDIDTFIPEKLSFCVRREEETLYEVILEFGNQEYKSFIYIVDFTRMCNERTKEHIGSRILDGIALLAQSYDFDCVGVNPVPTRSGDDVLDWDELEAWYKRHLENKDYEFIMGDLDKVYIQLNETVA